MAEKRFLIVAASIGSGHSKAAEAVAEELKKRNPKAWIRMVDFSAWAVSPATAFMKGSYFFMLRFIPNLYHLLYRFTGGKAGGLSMQSLISAVTARDIGALVRQYQPDVVICTHPFPAGAASWRKARHPQEFLFATVITDYSVHQMWMYPRVDCYFVARDEMKMELTAAGISPESVHVTGIPIMAAFHHAADREALCQKMDLAPDVPVVLLMGGGLGLGGVEAALSELEQFVGAVQILVVAGSNETLRQRVEALAKRSRHVIRAWGFSHEVRALMAVSSFLVSKPGALTISEALAVELPMLLHDPIPGPEAQNAAYLSQQGAAVWVSDPKRLREALCQLLQEPERLERMRLRARAMKRPDAAKKIGDILCQVLSGHDGVARTEDSQGDGFLAMNDKITENGGGFS
ncbi:MAG: MGDG synthase family glycosyltransferase [Schwartzia sp. (in: firmicutes)]